jgi:hypothetical protein
LLQLQPQSAAAKEVAILLELLVVLVAEVQAVQMQVVQVQVDRVTMAVLLVGQEAPEVAVVRVLLEMLVLALRQVQAVLVHQIL